MGGEELEIKKVTIERPGQGNESPGPPRLPDFRPSAGASSQGLGRPRMPAGPIVNHNR